MTPPMTPREKVAALKTNDPTNPAHRLARDLQAGRFASLEQRDDLIEVLSNLPRYAALASGSGDHAELARLARIWSDTSVTNHKMPGDTAVIWSRRLDALLAENAALRERLETARIARAAHNRQHGEAERKLAEAVGLLRDVVSPGWTRDAWSKARSFLSKEAERG